MRAARKYLEEYMSFKAENKTIIWRALYSIFTTFYVPSSTG